MPARLKAAFLPYLGSRGAITQNLMRLGLRDVSQSAGSGGLIQINEEVGGKVVL